MQRESAVVSITFRPRSIASRCVICVMSFAFDGVLRHQDRVGADLERAQRRRRVGGEERVARARGEDDDPVLLEVADRAPADVRLGDLCDLDRRLDARRCAQPLEAVLQRQRVEHGREHARVVGGRAVHALGRRGHAPVEVPGADHDRDLDPVLVDVDDLGRDRLHGLKVDAVLARPHQRLPGQLEEDAMERRLRH
jgi:hypothetical protein